MKTKKLRAVEVSALAVAAVVTVLAMLRAAAWQVDSGALLFLCWAVTPYVVFLVVSVGLERFTSLPKASLISCVVSLLMLGFTLLVYVGTLGDKSSTYGLIFLFVPVYLFIGSFAILVVGLVVAKLIEGRGSKNI